MSKAAATRLTILQKAFELIYTKGYQTTSIDDIIATTGVTKGAFYYHFKSKDDMGLAIIEELLRPAMRDMFVLPLKNSKDPVRDILSMTRHLLLENPVMQIEYGCPAGNLVQEMTPWNDAFRAALACLVDEWTATLKQCINNGKKSGVFRRDVQTGQVAGFIIAGYWGIRNVGKVYNDSACYERYLKQLKSYLNSLK